MSKAVDMNGAILDALRNERPFTFLETTSAAGKRLAFAVHQLWIAFRATL